MVDHKLVDGVKVVLSDAEIAQRSADDSGNMTDEYIAGYCNTTSAINAVQFKMSSGNFDGDILMFGIK